MKKFFVLISLLFLGGSTFAASPTFPCAVDSEYTCVGDGGLAYGQPNLIDADCADPYSGAKWCACPGEPGEEGGNSVMVNTTWDVPGCKPDPNNSSIWNLHGKPCGAGHWACANPYDCIGGICECTGHSWYDSASDSCIPCGIMPNTPCPSPTSPS